MRFKDFIDGSYVLHYSFPSLKCVHLKSEISLQIYNHFVDSSYAAYSFMGIAMDPYFPEIKNLRAFKKYFERQIANGEGDNVCIIPDILVVSDKKHFGDNGYEKVPKWVVEFVSPHNISKVFREKLELYEYIRIEEYWVISDKRNVFVFLLEDGKYVETEYSLDFMWWTRDDSEFLEISVKVFPDLKIKIKDE